LSVQYPTRMTGRFNYTKKKKEFSHPFCGSHQRPEGLLYRSTLGDISVIVLKDYEM